MKLSIYKTSNDIVPSELFALLKTADPSDDRLRSYLPASEIIIAEENNCLLGISVLYIGENSNDKRGQSVLFAELKNIAVAEAFQGRGIAKCLISEVARLAGERDAKSLWVGTGNSSLNQLALYQKCGFRINHVEKNAFLSYPEPIYENGIHCLDKLWLLRDLSL